MNPINRKHQKNAHGSTNEESSAHFTSRRTTHKVSIRPDIGQKTLFQRAGACCTRPFVRLVSPTLVETAPHLLRQYFGFTSSQNAKRTMALSAILLFNLLEVSINPLYKAERRTFLKTLTRPGIQYSSIVLNLSWLFGATLGYSGMIALRAYLVAYLAASLSKDIKQELNTAYQTEGASNLIKFLQSNGTSTALNPAQVVVEDVSQATQLICQLWDSRINSILQFSQAFWTLWAFSDAIQFFVLGSTLTIPYMPLVCIAYALLYNYLSDIIANALYDANAQYSSIKDKLYNRFAFDDTYAESLQFKNVSSQEHEYIQNVIVQEDSVRKNAREARTKLRMFNATHYRMRDLIPALLMAVKAIRTGELLDIGVLWDLADYFSTLNDFFTWHSDNIDDMANIENAASRINEFKETLSQCHSLIKKSEVKIQDDKPCFNGTIYDANQEPLAIFDNISLVDGNRYWLVWPSGYGKTTFFRLLSKQWPWGKGTFSRPEKTIFIPQVPAILPGDAPLIDSVVSQVYQYNPSFDRKEESTVQEIKELMRKLNFDDDIVDHVDQVEWITDNIQHRANWSKTLSGGQRARIGILPVLLLGSSNIDMLVLDEPFGGIDPQTAKIIQNLILEKFKNTTIIFTHHGEIESTGAKHPFYTNKMELNIENKKVTLT